MQLFFFKEKSPMFFEDTPPPLVKMDEEFRFEGIIDFGWRDKYYLGPIQKPGLSSSKQQFKGGDELSGQQGDIIMDRA